MASPARQLSSPELEEKLDEAASGVCSDDNSLHFGSMSEASGTRGLNARKDVQNLAETSNHSSEKQSKSSFQLVALEQKQDLDSTNRIELPKELPELTVGKVGSNETACTTGRNVGSNETGRLHSNQTSVKAVESSPDQFYSHSISWVSEKATDVIPFLEAQTNDPETRSITGEHANPYSTERILPLPTPPRPPEQLLRCFRTPSVLPLPPFNPSCPMASFSNLQRNPSASRFNPRSSPQGNFSKWNAAPRTGTLRGSRPRFNPVLDQRRSLVASSPRFHRPRLSNPFCSKLDVNDEDRGLYGRVKLIGDSIDQASSKNVFSSTSSMDDLADEENADEEYCNPVFSGVPRSLDLVAEESHDNMPVGLSWSLNKLSEESARAILKDTIYQSSKFKPECSNRYSGKPKKSSVGYLMDKPNIKSASYSTNCCRDCPDDDLLEESNAVGDRNAGTWMGGGWRKRKACFQLDWKDQDDDSPKSFSAAPSRWKLDSKPQIFSNFTKHKKDESRYSTDRSGQPLLGGLSGHRRDFDDEEFHQNSAKISNSEQRKIKRLDVFPENNEISREVAGANDFEKKNLTMFDTDPRASSTSGQSSTTDSSETAEVKTNLNKTESEELEEGEIADEISPVAPNLSCSVVLSQISSEPEKRRTRSPAPSRPSYHEEEWSYKQDFAPSYQRNWTWKESSRQKSLCSFKQKPSNYSPSSNLGRSAHSSSYYRGTSLRGYEQFGQDDRKGSRSRSQSICNSFSTGAFQRRCRENQFS